MSYQIHQFLLYLHIFVGALGLVVFWMPIVATKGSSFHKRLGKYFVWIMLTVSISGIVMSLMALTDPVSVRAPLSELTDLQLKKLIERSNDTSTFLLMLSMLVFVNTRQSVLVLKAKADRQIMKSVQNLLPIFLLFSAGIVVLFTSIQPAKPLFIAFSSLSIFVSIGSFRYIYKQELKPREWIIEHMGNIFGAGIGAYTAFFAFGGRRLFSEIFVGNMQMIPWLLPSVIGVASTIYLNKKYREKYKIH